MRRHRMAGLAALPVAVTLAGGVALAVEDGEVTIVLVEEPDIVDP